jgi:hypothetical protein
MARIEVDSQAAEILRRASQRAAAMGQTLGTYLHQTLPTEAARSENSISQRDAWNAFVSGMTRWAKTNLPPGHVADDDRDSIYE